MPTTFFIGDVALDEYFSADRWPGLGDKVMVQPQDSFSGGMIANAASVHAALGGSTEFISLLNTGPTSQRLCADLQQGGVGVTHMIYDDRTPDSRTIIVLVDNEHAVLIPELGNAPMELSGSAFDALCHDGLLYTTLGRIRRLHAGERDAIQVLASLHDAGRKVIYDLDVDGFTNDDVLFLRQAHVVIMNQQGFRRSFDDQDGPEAIQAWLVRCEISMLVVTQGDEGLIAYTREAVTVIDGLHVPVVDVTGAGDTFGGSLVYAIDRTSDLRTALSFANSAAAYAVTQMGPRGGMKSVDVILDFMDQHNVPEADAARAILSKMD